MRYYQPNPACRCGRCGTRGLMGPAVLITLGVLFLLANRPGFPFERTWPILLIVIGAIKVVRYVTPLDNHWNPGQYEPPYAGSHTEEDGVQNGNSANGSVVTPAPSAMEGAAGEGSDEVHNG